MGKQKQIGLENYLKFDSVKFLTKQLPSRTLNKPKSTQTSSRLLLTTAFNNKFMGKQKSIGLQNHLKFALVKISTI